MVTRRSASRGGRLEHLANSNNTRRCDAMRLVAPLIFATSTLATCGGRIEYREPDGYVDDQGIFHTKDGKALFEPGSKCAGYDRSSYAKPSPDCSDLNSDEPCTSWD